VNRKFRLTRSEDFKRVRRLGKSYAHPLAVLVAYPNEIDLLRIGVAAGKSVGNAVERNHAKRLLRAVLQKLIPQMTPGWDLLFLARQPMRQATYQQTEQALQLLVRRAQILQESYAG